MLDNIKQQMCGRAGRAGIDNFGESILVLRPDQRDQGLKLINDPLPPIRSCLCSEKGYRGFQRLVLDCICGKLATSASEIMEFFSHTLLFIQIEKEILMEAIISSINHFLLYEFIVPKTCRPLVDDVSLRTSTPIEEEIANEAIISNSDQDSNSDAIPRQAEKTLPHINYFDNFSASLFGEATFHSSFSPEHESILVKHQLEEALDSLVLSDELHMCYLITPMWNLPIIADWMSYFYLFTKLSAKRIHVASIIGIQDSFFYTQAISHKICTHTLNSSSSIPSNTINILMKAQRFYFAMVLEELLNEAPLFEIEKKYKVNRGALQSLMVSAQSFAGQIVNFCRTIGYWHLAELLSTYCKRLNFGVKPEILPLTEIPGVKKIRARALWNAGFRTVRQIAIASPEEIYRTTNLGPHGFGVAKKIVRAARELLEKKAKELRETAEEMLNLEESTSTKDSTWEQLQLII